MSEAMVEKRRPGDTDLSGSDLRRRQRGKNLVVAAFLLAMAVAFFALTIVRMGDKP
jgi:hypothetical protein